ncbi:hypothetical protein D3C72_1787800 [compost metagenome]
MPPSKRSRFRTVASSAVVAVVVDRVLAVVANSRAVQKVAHQKPQANRRVAPVMQNLPGKTRGAAGKLNPQVKANADAARVNLLQRSNLEARP